MRKTGWRRLSVAMAVVLWAGCASVPELGPEDFVAANRVTEEIVVAEPPAAAGGAELLTQDDPELAEAGASLYASSA